MTLLKVIEQVPRANYIEGAQMLQEQRMRKIPRSGFDVVLRTTIKVSLLKGEGGKGLLQ